MTPNRSASWQQSKMLVYGLGFITLTIALVWSLVGAWLVLPFAGLEVFVLWLVSYLTCRKTYFQQVLEIDPHKISISSGLRYPDECVVMDTRDVVFQYSEADTPLEEEVLYLKTSAKRCRVGAFLNTDDLKELRQRLKEAGLFEQPKQWWKNRRG